MSMFERDLSIIEKIVNYCEEINNAVSFFGDEYDIFRNNSIYKNAVSMCILQIGELSGHLTDDFRNTYNKVPWRLIRGMRNVVVHAYGNVDMEELWNTVHDDIPVLKAYCRKIILDFLQN